MKTGQKTGVELRYYKKPEWFKLSREEQEEVRDHRKQHNKRKAEAQNSTSAKIAALESKVEAQLQVIASLTTQQPAQLPPVQQGNPPLRPPSGFTQRQS